MQIFLEYDKTRASRTTGEKGIKFWQEMANFK